jgi:hypothetical protein
MDSELADVAAVKGINQALTTTSTPTFGGITGIEGGNFTIGSAGDNDALIITSGGKVVTDGVTGTADGTTSCLQFASGDDWKITSVRSGTGSRGHINFQQNSGDSIGGITTNGSSTSYGTSSDYRLKENVDYTWDATTRLKQLKPCRFNFIADASNTLVDGFLAHEVQTVVPEAITGTHNEVDDDGNAVMQNIDQSKLAPILVKTVLELEARITVLEGA